MIATLVIGAAGLVAALLVYAATRPGTFRVARDTTIAAPAERILALVGDFRNWEQWSPWEKLDPAMRKSLDGAESGRGAVYTWQGNGKVGAGRMEITAISPSQVTIALHFIKPFQSRSMAEFMLEPDRNATRVTWAMHGRSPFMAKLMGIFCNMDRLIGRDFESGLANLKAVAEGQGAGPALADRTLEQTPLPG